MKLNSISIRTVYNHQYQLEFNIRSWCIQEQYWSYLKNYDVSHFRKVIVRVDDAIITGSKEIDESLTDVIAINKYFDIAGFLNLDKSEKKKSLLELLHSCMLHLAERYGWEMEPLLTAYRLCVDSNLEYKFKVKDKDFKSPTKGLTGYVQCYWDMEMFSATIVISLTKSNNIVRKQLLDFEPHMAEFIYYATCRWESNTTFSMIAKDGRKWSVSTLSLE